MGASVSSQVINQTSSVVNTAMTNMVTKNTSKIDAVSVNANKINIDLTGAIIKNCDLDFTQKIDASQAVKAMAKFTSITDMQQKLTTALQSQAEQSSKQTQQALSLSLGVTTGIQNINSAIANHVSTNLRSETLNKVNAYLANKNGITIMAAGLNMTCNKGLGRFKVDQSIVSQQTAKLLADTIMNTKNDVTTESKIVTQSGQTAVTDQKGIQEIISALGLTIMLPLFICLGVVLIFVLPGLLKGMGKGGNKMGNNFMFGFGRRKLRFGGRR